MTLGSKVIKMDTEIIILHRKCNQPINGITFQTSQLLINKNQLLLLFDFGPANSKPLVLYLSNLFKRSKKVKVALKKLSTIFPPPSIFPQSMLHPRMCFSHLCLFNIWSQSYQNLFVLIFTFLLLLYVQDILWGGGLDKVSRKVFPV